MVKRRTLSGADVTLDNTIGMSWETELMEIYRTLPILHHYWCKRFTVDAPLKCLCWPGYLWISEAVSYRKIFCYNLSNQRGTLVRKTSKRSQIPKYCPPGLLVLIRAREKLKHSLEWTYNVCNFRTMATMGTQKATDDGQKKRKHKQLSWLYCAINTVGFLSQLSK